MTMPQIDYITHMKFSSYKTNASTQEAQQIALMETWLRACI